MDPTCSKEYDPKRPWRRTKKCGSGYNAWLDELMAQIPGLDNYGANISQNRKGGGKVSGEYKDPLTGEPLNIG